MQVTKNTQIYILCPAAFHTGGPTLLHQLCATLRGMGMQAVMYYYPSGVTPEDGIPVHPAYRSMMLPYVSSIQPRPENVLIYPETATYLVPRDFQIQRVLWWLSVDNWLSNLNNYFQQLVAQTDHLQMPLGDVEVLSNPTLTHWVQSEYARQFLRMNGVPEERIFYVSDYLEPEYLSRSQEAGAGPREDIVAFNPRKGTEFTIKLMESSLDLHWRPIENMTPAQVEAFLHRAKVYVDFGNHPGKDRIPREAAVCGCCVLTGRRGAAGNAVDMPIPESCKFADTEENVPAIVAKIRELLQNYASSIGLWESYRQKILQEPAQFRADVERAIHF